MYFTEWHLRVAENSILVAKTRTNVPPVIGPISGITSNMDEVSETRKANCSRNDPDH